MIKNAPMTVKISAGILLCAYAAWLMVSPIGALVVTAVVIVIVAIAIVANYLIN